MGFLYGITTWVLHSLIGAWAPELSDRFYSRGIYPYIGNSLSAVSSLVPFSLTDFSFFAILSVLITTFVLGYRRNRSLISGFLFSLSAACFFYSLFQVLWGFNYLRNPLTKTLGVAQPLTATSRKKLLTSIAQKSNHNRSQTASGKSGSSCFELSQSLPSLNNEISTLESGLLAKMGQPGLRHSPIKVRPAGKLLLQIGNSGIYGPFTGEANVTIPAAPGMLPFMIAHERGHLQGFASETDASVLAFLALFSSTDPAQKYAGHLAFWAHISEAERQSSGLGKEVLGDIACLREFWKRFEGIGQKEFHQIYSLYLKAQGQKRGLQTYSDSAEIFLRYLANQNIDNF